MITYPFGVGALKTRVIEAGTGDATVVLIHGVAARADRWRANLDVIADAGFHCYAIDMPGHGFADKKPDFPYGVPGFAGFVGEFLDAIGCQKTILVGTSLGGHTSAMFTCRNPDRVRALVLVGATGLFRLGEEARLNISKRIKDTDRDGIASKLSHVVHDDTALVTEAWIDEETRINNSPGAAAAFEGLSRYFATRLDEDAVGEELASHAGSIRMLLVWGTEDRSVPLSVGEKAAEILGAPLKRMERAAHAPYFEKPDEFNEAVIGFLKGLA